MTPRRKEEPFEQGCLAEIYRGFIAPFIKYKPLTLTLKEWQEFLFHAVERDITRYEATAPFRLPGEFYAAGALPVQGVGYREIKPGDILYVRTDKRHPDFVDVEALSASGKKDEVFKLNKAQWCYIARFLKEAERRKR